MLKETREVDIEKGVFRFCQWGVGSLVVDAFVEALKLGQEMPPLIFQEFGPGFYGLDVGFYGVFEGNHRFMAYERLGMNPSWEYAPGWAEVADYGLVRGDVDFVDGDSNRMIRSKLIDALGFLPRDVVERFCFEKKLDSNIYLTQ